VLPAKAGAVMSSEDGTPTDDHTRTTYRSGVGKVLQPDICPLKKQTHIRLAPFYIDCVHKVTKPFFQNCMAA
jgi:hypothetical protein